MKKALDKLRFIHWLFVAKHRFKSVTHPNHLLEKGEYYVTCNRRTYLIMSGVSNENLTMIEVDLRKPRLKAFQIEERTNEELPLTAQVVMSTNNTYRFFNFSEGYSFRFFSCTEEAEAFDLSQKAFANFFNLTTIRYNTNFCAEQIINNKPRSQWTKEEVVSNFYKLSDCYTCYLKSTTKIFEPVDCKYESVLKIDEFLQLCEELKDAFSSYRNTKHVFTHSDLHFGNTLFDGEKVYLIDFEMARKDVFFYDIYNMMYVEFIDWNNHTFVDDYLSKEPRMVSLFVHTFEAVGEVFDPRCATLYFDLFLFRRLISAVTDCKKKYKGRNLKKSIIYNVKVVESMHKYVNNNNNGIMR